MSVREHRLAGAGVGQGERGRTRPGPRGRGETSVATERGGHALEIYVRPGVQTERAVRLRDAHRESAGHGRHLRPSGAAGRVSERLAHLVMTPNAPPSAVVPALRIRSTVASPRTRTMRERRRRVHPIAPYNRIAGALSAAPARGHGGRPARRPQPHPGRHDEPPLVPEVEVGIHLGGPLPERAGAGPGHEVGDLRDVGGPSRTASGAGSAPSAVPTDCRPSPSTPGHRARGQRA